MWEEPQRTGVSSDVQFLNSSAKSAILFYCIEEVSDLFSLPEAALLTKTSRSAR